MGSRLTFPLAGGSAHKDSCAIIGGLVPPVVVAPTVAVAIAVIATQAGFGFVPLDGDHRDETQIQRLHGLSPRCLRCLVVGSTLSGTPRMPPFLFVSSTILDFSTSTSQQSRRLSRRASWQRTCAACPPQDHTPQR